MTVQFGAASYTATEGGTAATVTVNLSADPERSVTIPIIAEGAGGTGSGDYTLSETSVTIDSGDTSATFVVTATDDDVYDGAEALTLSFGDLPSKVTAAGTQGATEVNLVDNEILSTSSLVPTGINAGDGFRLLFVTSHTRDAASTDIDDYNEFVQTAAAAGHEDIQPYSALFRALGSTEDVDAIDNTATTHTTAQPGVPIWWLNGPLAADDYGDFYDGSWDNRDPGRNESGSEVDFGDTDQVWTGTENDGTATIPILGSVGTTTYATPGVGTNLHFVGGAASSSEAKPLYGLSFVLHVVAAPPAVDSATVSSDGTTIEIVFDEDLDRTGSAPAADAFEVTVDGGTAVNPDSADFHATDADTITLTMGSADAVAAGATVSVAYDQPTSNALADAASNEVADFTQTALNRPAAPVVTQAAMRSDGLLLAWSAPEIASSLDVTGYEARYKLTGAADVDDSWTTVAVGATSPYTITGLADSAGYNVRMRAVIAWNSGDYYGDWSEAKRADNPWIVDSGVAVTSLPESKLDGVTFYGRDETIEFTVEFNEAVTVTGEPEFEFCLGAVDDSCTEGADPPARRRAAYSSGDDTDKLVFSYVVGLDATDLDTDGIRIGDSAIRLGADENIVSADTETAAHLGHAAPGIQTGHRVDDSNKVDTTAPSVSSAKVSEDGMTILIVFDQELDSSSTVAVGEFAVTVGAALPRKPSGAALSGTDTVTLTMTPAIAAGETVSVA